jgi:hypothetical protein
LESFWSFEDEIEWLRMLHRSGQIVRLHASEVDWLPGRISIVRELPDIDLVSLITKNRGHLHQIDWNFLRVM